MWITKDILPERPRTQDSFHIRPDRNRAIPLALRLPIFLYRLTDVHGERVNGMLA